MHTTARPLLIFNLCLFFFASCDNNPNKPEINIPSLPQTPIINYSVIKLFPHDTSLFTEGLVVHNGKLFESTGSPGNLPHTQSLIGIHNLENGQFENKITLDRSKYFGEGIAFLHKKLFQLTYKTNIGFVYDELSFKKIGEFSFASKEGWSLTNDSTNLIMSDGTDTLTFINPGNLDPVKILKVTENGLPLIYLNELEFIKGYIYANVWTTNYIVKIDPQTGNVVGKLDLSSLSYEARNINPHIDETNGIAYDSVSDKIYVTGKMWPSIYQINFPH